VAIRFAICPKENPPPVLKRHPLHAQVRFVSNPLIKLIVSFQNFFLFLVFCFFSFGVVVNL
jgi:hypothetical protein